MTHTSHAKRRRDPDTTAADDSWAAIIVARPRARQRGVVLGLLARGAVYQKEDGVKICETGRLQRKKNINRVGNN